MFAKIEWLTKAGVGLGSQSATQADFWGDSLSGSPQLIASASKAKLTTKYHSGPRGCMEVSTGGRAPGGGHGGHAGCAGLKARSS